MPRLFTADWHLGHGRVAEYRGFSSTKEHDDWVKTLVREAVLHAAGGENAQRSPKQFDDNLDNTHLWVLGDLCLKNFDENVYNFLDRTYCQVHIIAGNHDEVHPMHRNSHKSVPRWLEVVESIDTFKRLRSGKDDFLLSHFPYVGAGDHTEQERYAQYRLPDLGLPLVSAHVHAEWTAKKRMLNVGVDAGKVFTDSDIRLWIDTLGLGQGLGTLKVEKD